MSSQGGIYQPGNNTDQTLIHKGLVVSVPDDLTGFAPIKCRVEVIDSMIYNDNDLSDCYSLLPKHLNVYPKKGEYVYILTLNSDYNKQIRYYLGPVIDVYKNLNFNPDDNVETNAPIRADIRQQPDKGIYPKREYISIQGRNNSDIVFKEQEVLLRAGKYVTNSPLKFNSLDTAYIQMRYGQPELKETNRTEIVREVKLITPEGFANANLIFRAVLTDPYQVNISFEDKNNKFFGRIFKNFGTEDEAIVFIKQTYINLQKNDNNTKLLILDNFGRQINVGSYDFSKFKYINTSIDRLKTFDINKLTEIVEKPTTIKVTETVFNDSKGSGINVVGNKINLISYGNKNNFKLLDPDVTITAEQQLKINTESQPIPYGYVLNDFLGLVKSFVANHVHAYHGLPPDPDPIVNQILNYDLETILNQNVRTA
jgi:hypothetical protein